VLVVTLNRGAHGYLKDETGNRRFWPVLCGALWKPGRCIDLEALKAERDQLWAEADYRFGQGERWWLHEPELLDQHEISVSERHDLEPMHHKVAKAMDRLVAEGKTEPTFEDVCGQLGLLSVKDVTRLMQVQIGRALTALGWSGKQEMRNGERHTWYVRNRYGYQKERDKPGATWA
jgi:virulence-associated protein E